MSISLYTYYIYIYIYIYTCDSGAHGPGGPTHEDRRRECRREEAEEEQPILYYGMLCYDIQTIV